MSEFYDEHFATIVRRQSPEYLAQVKDFLQGILGARPGFRILDQGCGIGQISRTLAQAGFDVLGCDFNADYIQEARQHGSEQANLKLNFVCADAREFSADPVVDAVISWHTSFGHYSADAEQVAILKSAYRSLKAGGHLILDYPNFYATLRQFEPVFVQTYPFEQAQLEVRRHSQIDAAQGLLHQRWEFLYPEGRQAERQAAIKIYLPHELISLIQQAGFRLLRLYGSIDPDPGRRGFDVLSRRCILQAQKPEDLDAFN